MTRLSTGFLFNRSASLSLKPLGKPRPCPPVICPGQDDLPRPSLLRLSLFTIFVFILAFALLPSPVAAQEPPSFEIVPEVPAVELGSRVDIVLRPRSDNFDPDRILDVGFEGEVDEAWHVVSDWQRTVTTTPGGTTAPATETWTATLQPFAVGQQELPRVLVIYQGDNDTREEVLADSLTIGVRGVLEETDPDDIRPARLSMPEFPRDWTPFILAGLGIAGAAALAIVAYVLWLRRRRRLTAMPSVGPDLPPGAWALDELQRRRELPEVAEGGPKATATHAAEVIRRYLGRRFDFHALEMTSHEILQYLEAISTAFETQEMIESFLYFCDYIKFSDQPVPPHSVTGLWLQAAEIVIATTPEGEQHEREFRKRLPRDLRHASAAAHATEAGSPPGEPAPVSPETSASVASPAGARTAEQGDQS